MDAVLDGSGSRENCSLCQRKGSPDANPFEDLSIGSEALGDGAILFELIRGRGTVVSAGSDFGLQPLNKSVLTATVSVNEYFMMSHLPIDLFQKYACCASAPKPKLP
jgi:hypothetical protein